MTGSRSSPSPAGRCRATPVGPSCCGRGGALHRCDRQVRQPLHTWLPDAMAGPTPVSALRTPRRWSWPASTQARLYPVFFEGFRIGQTDVNLIAVIGGITIVIAAVLAFVQVDIKRVLAYSTVSQLGYMMMGLGVGAWLRPCSTSSPTPSSRPASSWERGR